MLPTYLLYHAATKKTVIAGENICLLCGCRCEETVPVVAVIRDTFTDHGILRAKESSVACPACAHYFNHRWQVGQKRETEYRKQSMFVTPDAFRSWQRTEMQADLERLLRDGTRAETLLVMALSKKKHLVPLPRCQTTPAGQRVLHVQLESEALVITPEAYQAVRRPFDQLLLLGCRKGEILSGDYSPLTLRKAPALDVLALDRQIAPWRPSGLLSLVSYITILEDRDDDAERTVAGSAAAE